MRPGERAATFFRGQQARGRRLATHTGFGLVTQRRSRAQGLRGNAISLQGKWYRKGGELIRHDVGEAAHSLDVARRHLEEIEDDPPETRTERQIKRGQTIVSEQWVKADAEVSRLAFELMRTVHPAMAQAFEAKLFPVAEKVVADWPVKSGLSKSLVSFTFRRTAEGDITAALESRAPYTYYIRWAWSRRKRDKIPAGQDPAKSVWWWLARKPFEAARDEIAEAIEGGLKS